MVTMPRSEVTDTVCQLAMHFQGTTFTTAQAEAAGIAAHRVKTAVRTGDVLRLRRGHYRIAVDSEALSCAQRSQQPTSPVPGLTPLEESRVRDAITAMPTAPVALGLMSAGGSWEIPTWEIPPAPTPVLLVPRGSGLRSGERNGLRFVVREVRADRIVTGPGGIPMTDPLLTGIHLAGTTGLSLSAQLVVLHGAMRRHQEFDEAAWSAHAHGSHATHAHTVASTRLGSHELARLMADHDVRQALIERSMRVVSEASPRGTRRVMRALEVADPRVETALESLSWGAFHKAGMTMPTPQALVRGASGKLWRVDFVFGGRVIGECDGAVKYQSADALWQEKKRQMDLENAGYIVVRWTWEEIVYRPEVVLERIARALERAARLAS